MRIEICGGIGAGKTTVANILSAHLSCQLVSESYRNIPFWEPFFNDPKRYSLQKNVGFALSHGERLHSSKDSGHAVSDFALIQDLAYAEIFHDEEEIQVVSTICKRIVSLIGNPSILIRVMCRLDQQLDRIKQRGREAERAASVEFINNLNCLVHQKALFLAQDAPVQYFELDTTEWSATDLRREWSSRLSPIIAAFDSQVQL